jgi:C-terminal processing protease CtpA/Prc
MPETDTADTPEIGLPVENAIPLADFLANRPILTIADRRLIVQQAIGLLENAYVHMPVKRILYGIDPVRRLRTLEASLEANAGSEADDLPFHREMVAILSDCRDMHTGYYLPRPFDRCVAFLPFHLEEYYEEAERRYVVPRLLSDFPEIKAEPAFQRGVEIVAWDGEPIEHAIVREGERSPGINAWARHARGLCRLTTRFLAKCPPPDRQSVRVTYRTQGREDRTVEMTWRVVPLPRDIQSLPEGVPIGQARHQTLDFETEVFRALKHELSVRPLDGTVPASIERQLIETDLSANFEAFVRTVANGTPYGYIRIRTFVVDRADEALAAFVQLLKQMPANGLVIDVRDNPGGSIEAAEMMLQALAGQPLERAQLVFRNTPFILRLCQQDPKRYARWTRTLERAQATGTLYSGGVPLLPDQFYENIERSFVGPVALIVNALSYSATDFFAAGFQDHNIGTVLGVDGSTGGGGANVLSLQQLVDEVSPNRARFAGLWQPVPLPAGADFHFAFRRSIRTGRYSGLEVEDFGVTPDVPIYHMSRRDALEGNPDLFEQAAKLLGQ